MQRRSRYLIGGCGALFALAIAYVVGVEMSATTAATSPNLGAQTVNRSIKGDRLTITPATRMPAIPASKSRRNATNEPHDFETPAATPTLQLLDGCEPIVSPIGQSPLSLVPGRCVS